LQGEDNLPKIIWYSLIQNSKYRFCQIQIIKCCHFHGKQPLSAQFSGFFETKPHPRSKIIDRQHARFQDRPAP
ncbi:MAG TPA: hypothetical protein DCR17_16280, partial [Verrucomicrobiales bacterium]|nr:hypothetical protein [Verrucomicrobiales bacterium]